MMKEAIEEAVLDLKQKYPAVQEVIKKGREKYSQQIEREGFFPMERLTGEYSQPLKDNSEIDLESLVTFFS